MGTKGPGTHSLHRTSVATCPQQSGHGLVLISGSSIHSHSIFSMDLCECWNLSAPESTVCSAIGQHVQCHNGQPWGDKKNKIQWLMEPGQHESHTWMAQRKQPLWLVLESTSLPFNKSGVEGPKEKGPKTEKEKESHNSYADLNPLCTVSEGW